MNRNWTPTLAWVVGACSVLAGGSGAHASDGSWVDESLTASQIQAASVSAQLSTVIYDTATVASLWREHEEHDRLQMSTPERMLAGGWRIREFQDDADGFRAAAFERTLANGHREIMVSYAGTRGLADAVTDISQGNPLPMGAVDRIFTDNKFRKAQDFAEKQVKVKDLDSNTSLEFTGQSLGGAYAQVCSLKFGVKATVFNSAAVVKAGWDQVVTGMKENARSLITQFVSEADFVHDPTMRIPGATQYGKEYRVRLPEGMKRGDIAWSDTGHGMELMNLSLEHAYQVRMGMVSGAGSGFDRLEIRRVDRSGERVAVVPEALEVVTRDLIAVGKGVEEMGRLTKIGREFSGRDKPEAFERFAGGVGKAVGKLEVASEVADMIKAIRLDQEQFKDKPAVLLDSKVAEKLSDMVLKGTKIPGLKELPGAGGMVKKVWELAEENKLIRPQISFDKAYEKGAPTFGVIELGKAAVSQVREGRASIDTVEKYLNGAVGMTWATVGYLSSGGNLAVAERTQQYGEALAASGSYLMRETGTHRELLKWVDPDFRNQGESMTQMYEAHVERALYARVKPMSPDQFYSAQTRKEGGVSAEQYGRMERTYQDVMQRAPRDLKTMALKDDGTSAAELAANAKLASGLAGAGHKAVIFGDGPGAEKAYRDMGERMGMGNVKLVRVAPSSYERSWIADQFGADVVVRISQERYRTTVEGGVRRVERLPLYEAPAVVKPELPKITKPAPITVPEMARATGMQPGAGSASFARDVFSRATAPPLQSQDSFTRFTPPRVGGVMLQGAAEVSGGSKGNEGLATGNFSLIFQGGDEAIDIPTLRRFVTALWATYFTKDGPGISIDPVGNFTNRHAVRYIGRVINSDLGRVMRETDYKMKCWMVGSGRPELENWLSPEEIGIRDGTVHVGAPSRFWFVPEGMKFRQAGNALLFEGGRMRVKTEYLGGGKETNPENEKWAKQFTDRYGEVAMQYPAFEELFEYAKLVSLAKYLKERRVPLLWFLLANREMALTENSPGTVKAFVKKSEYFEGLQGAGGVDLSPSAEPGSFVMDSELLSAIADARKSRAASESEHTLAEAPKIEVVEDKNEKLTVTPAQTVVISDTRGVGDNFATDLGMRLNGNPQLELARYRRTDFPQVHTFGRDWHLMIPYAVRPASAQRIRCGTLAVPEMMVLRNQLTGIETQMPFRTELKMGTNSIPVAGYFPEDPETSLNIGLIPMSDNTWRLDDKLGCEFEFDERGRLIRMLLADHLEYATNSSGRIMGTTRAKDYEVGYEYRQQRLNWRYYSTNNVPLPFRLAPEGKGVVEVQGFSAPKTVRLVDTATGSEEAFTFDETNANGVAGYLPSTNSQSGFAFLAYGTDGTLLLQHKSGSQIAFDRSGEFRYMMVDTLDRMVQGPHEVRFEYGLAGGQYRIVAARVRDRKTQAVQYAVLYEYARDGNLARTRLLSAN